MKAVVWWLMVVFLMSSTSYALVDKTQSWLPLQQIAVNPSSDVSVDEDGNGRVDDADKLGGLTKDDFFKVRGDTLKGIMFLYYGVGKIVDLDNPSYFIDPSYMSNFNRLCIQGNCISSWNDVVSQQQINDSYIISLIDNVLFLREDNLNVNSSQYAYNIVGINKGDLLNVLYLRNYCINNDCSQGVDASSLNGYVVGENVSNIPVINPSVVYFDLKVGYAEFSSMANNTYYVGNMSTTNIISKLLSLEENVDRLVIDVEYLKEENKTLWSVVSSLSEQISDEEVIVLEGLKSSKVVDAILLLLEEENYIKIPQSCRDESFVFIKKEDDKLEIECMYKNKIEDYVEEVLKGKKCLSGVSTGFKNDASIRCISYYSLASKIIPYIKKEGFVSESYLLQILKDYVKSKDIEGKYVGLPESLSSCNRDSVLSYYYDTNKGKWVSQCKEILIGMDISFGSAIAGIHVLKNTPEVVDNGKATSISLVKGNDGGYGVIECPKGSIMTGIVVQYEDVNDNFGKRPVVYKINAICRNIYINSEAE